MKVYRVAMLGHKDHGKSTLIGSLLIKTKSVTKQRIEEAKKASKELGKAFEPAFLLDSFYEEQRNGMTLDTTRAEIHYKNVAIELIDVPGHEELIKNMITGASYASAAVLIISAKKNEGIRPQTKRHLYLASMLGIDKLLVAVNKMDTVNYSDEVFNNIKNGIEPFIKELNLKEYYFVPISAYNGENLTTNSIHMKWYKGKPLLDVLLRLLKTNKSKDKRFIGIVQSKIEDKFAIHILNGELKSNDLVKVLPQGKIAKVKSIYNGLKPSNKAKVGDNVMISTDVVLNRGDLLVHKNDKLEPVSMFLGKIFLAKNIDKRNVIIRINGLDYNAKISFIKRIDPTRNKELDGKPEQLEVAIVKVNVEKSVAVEPFEINKDIGKFTIFDNKNNFLGFGNVLKL